MVSLAVFDCDGTLVDSQINIVRAMDSVFESHGLAPPSSHAVRRVVGLSLAEAMAALLPDGDATLFARLAADYRRAFQTMRGDGRLDPEPLYPGVIEGLDRLAGLGWKLGVATGKSDRGLAMVLAHHDILGRFVTLQTADRHPSKPHPAMLNAALAEAGATADDAVIVGDTVYDIAMGVAAGVRAIGATWGYHEAGELAAAGAARVTDSFAEAVDAIIESTS